MGGRRRSGGRRGSDIGQRASRDHAVGTCALAVEALWLTPRELSTFANLIGLQAVGNYASRRRALWGPVILLPGIAAFFAGEEGAVPPAVPAGAVFGWLCVWAVGYAGARRREQQESDRQLMRRDAVLDERHRVARELHDLIGHTMSVMLVRVAARWGGLGRRGRALRWARCGCRGRRRRGWPAAGVSTGPRAGGYRRTGGRVRRHRRTRAG